MAALELEGQGEGVFGGGGFFVYINVVFVSLRLIFPFTLRFLLLL